MSARTAIVRKRQKGRKRTQRVQRYKRNKAKAKRTGAAWRKRNQAKIRRNRKKRKRNPAQHRLRHATAFFGETLLADSVAFWDLQGDCEGSVTSFGSNDRIHTIVDGSPKVYSVDEFLEGCVPVTDEDEDALFQALDPLFQDNAEIVAAIYLGRET